MKPDTIVIINDFAFVDGGASQVALGSALELTRRGHTVHLFAAVGPVSDEIAASDIKVTLLDHHDIAGDPSRMRAVSHGVWNREARARLTSLLSRCDPSTTVVHLHVWVKSLSAAVCRAVSDSTVSGVVTLHDYFVACPNGGFFNYPRAQICRLRPLSRACLVSNCDKRSYPQKLWRFVRQVVQRRAGRMPGGFRHFISVTDFSEEILKPFLPVNATLHRVANPVRIARGERARPAESKRYAFVGRLDPEKGSTLMARAIARLGLESVFVGDGSCRREIETLLSGVEITGWVRPEQVRAVLSQSRALVFPSLWYETQGLTVLEAAALGLPAIVPDTSAASEMVEDGRTGLIFRGGDVDDLAEKITRLQDDRLVAELGSAAYDRYWAAPCDPGRHVEELLAVYGRILESRAENRSVY